jgi:DNA polymerase III delta subunit
VGGRAAIATEDVEAVVVRNKQARAFALAEAVGDRDLPRLLRTLDTELWEMKTNSQKSEIGILYGVISKIRALIYLKEMLAAKRLRAEPDYPRFKAQLEPSDAASGQEKSQGPLSFNPYVLFKALPQVRRYDRAELVQAMERLLDCNRRLVSSGGESARILQQTLVEIVRPSA